MKTKLRSNVGEKIAALVKSKMGAYNNTTLSSKVGISRPSLIDILKGKDMKVTTFQSIVQVLNITQEEIRELFK